ncbi:MAG: DUF4823 domain-containing protein [Deltaproteobacteria bacterium]|jgi:hypothetical protein|nr:DUF4823 domain-containing protein [Deltaproteobacteria bacterium]
MYIAMPHNSGKGAETAEAATQTQQALQEVLSRTAGEKIYAPMAQGLSEGIVSAKAAACMYFLWIEILDWYDPPAFFQIFPDRGEVVLSVYDAQTGDLLQSDKISCKGFATTVNLIGAYSPKDCLKAAFGAWLTKNM